MRNQENNYTFALSNEVGEKWDIFNTCKFNTNTIYMKKTLLFLAVALLSAGSAFAQHFQHTDGLYYNILGGDSVEVAHSKNPPTSSLGNKNPGTTPITIPDEITYQGKTYRVTAIGEKAFYSYKDTAITIGRNVQIIREYAFYNSKLENIYFLGNQCHTIEDHAFGSNTHIKKLDIPEGVVNLGAKLFTNSYNIDSVTLPSTIKHIGKSAFFASASPETIYIDYVNFTGTLADWCGITFEDEAANPYSYSKKMYINHELVTSIDIPDNVTSVGQYAFYNLPDVISVTIGKDVQTIGKDAFYYLPNVKKIVCHSNPTTSNSGGNLLLYATQVDEIIAPASFFDYTENNWLNLTKSLTNVKVNAGRLSNDGFAVINRSATTLTTLDLSAVTNTTFADGAFAGCYKLENFTFPDSVKEIGYMSFTDCMSLRSVDIPAAVTEIGDRAFEHCRSLQKVTFGGAEASETTALTSIGAWAFYCCHALENITLPEGVTEVGADAFWGCSYLQDVTLPSTLRKVGNNSFAGCSKLQRITSKALVPPVIEDKTFFEVSRQTPVYVPTYTSQQDYEADPYWGEFFCYYTLDGTTGLETTLDANQATTRKVLENGTMYIIRGDEKYTTTGVRVQ